MRILIIDTSAVASAALLDFSLEDSAGNHTVVAEFATADTRSHAEVLAPGVNSLFENAVVEGPALDAIVVGTGPGPFTGLRSGIAMARTLAFTWNVPLFGLMSLDALAEEVRLSANGLSASGLSAILGGDFVIATDARRKEVYWATYSADGAVVDGPHVGPATEVTPRLPVFGAGAGIYRADFDANSSAVDVNFELSQPTALFLGLAAIRRIVAAGSLAGAGFTDTTPLYMRDSDAKVPGPRKKAL